MKERPVLFSGAMVRAILGGHKTQTRRVMKPVCEIPDALAWHEETSVGLSFAKPGYWRANVGGSSYTGRARCPYGVPGDRLWVRETFKLVDGERPEIYYRASDSEDGPWTPSIFMPRHLSRITLDVVNVRVERLQDITEQDSRAEGITDGGCLNCGKSEPCGCSSPKPDARDSYVHLWESIYGKVHPWHSNPWVWVVEFTKATTEPNSLEVGTCSIASTQ